MCPKIFSLYYHYQKNVGCHKIFDHFYHVKPFHLLGLLSIMYSFICSFSNCFAQTLLPCKHKISTRAGHFIQPTFMTMADSWQLLPPFSVVLFINQTCQIIHVEYLLHVQNMTVELRLLGYFGGLFWGLLSGSIDDLDASITEIRVGRESICSSILLQTPQWLLP